jgi:hypothetical protein
MREPVKDEGENVGVLNWKECSAFNRRLVDRQKD